MDSPIRWQGGKSRLARKIVAMFPKHTCYVEAFGGAAWVLFAKSPNSREILNDANTELMNFWEVVRTKKDQLLDSMKWDIPSRYAYNSLRKMNPAEMTDIERARRLYWMAKATFGGIYEGRFGTSKRDGCSMGLSSLEARLELINKRLKNITIECKDAYTGLSATYDSADTFWYLDPPYLGTNTEGHGSNLDLSKLEALAKSLKGKVAISHNVNEVVREAFEGWNFVELGRRQNCIGNNTKSAGTHAFEWLITNYEPPT